MPTGKHSGRCVVTSTSQVAALIARSQFDKTNIAMCNHNENLQKKLGLYRSYKRIQYPVMLYRSEHEFDIMFLKMFLIVLKSFRHELLLLSEMTKLFQLLAQI